MALLARESRVLKYSLVCYDFIMSALILVADDESKIRSMVCEYLEKMGFRTLAVEEGTKALKIIEEQVPDLVLLDVMMPGLDGFSIAKQLLNRSSPPFLFMTARDEEADKVLGLELGADDYITKPFSLRELTARIHAVLRRVHTSDEAPIESYLRWKDLVVDLNAVRVTKGKHEVTMTSVQFQILVFFLRSPGRVWSRSQILDHVRDSQFVGYERTIDVHVKNLRKALGDDVKAPLYIETVRGLGYRLVSP